MNPHRAIRNPSSRARSLVWTSTYRSEKGVGRHKGHTREGLWDVRIETIQLYHNEKWWIPYVSMVQDQIISKTTCMCTVEYN